MSFSITYLDNDILLKNKIEEFISNWNDSSFFIETKTSGSTGKPKSIQLSKAQMIASAKITGEYFGLNEDQTTLLCLSIDTIAGKMMLVRAIVHNMKILITSPSSNPLKKIEERIDFIAIVPLQLDKMIEESSIELKNIKNILIGGASLPSPISDKLIKLNLTCFQSFGMTETVSHIAIRKVGKNEELFYTTLPGIKLIQNPENELIITAPHLSIYELKTNDIIELLSENQFVWKGRKDFVINSGGVKIFPEEVEKKISNLIDLPFFITSIPDVKLGEKLVLIIESDKLINLYIDDFKSVLTKYELPKEIFYLRSFERTISGKINRIKTKALLTF